MAAAGAMRAAYGGAAADWDPVTTQYLLDGGDPENIADAGVGGANRARLHQQVRGLLGALVG